MSHIYANTLKPLTIFLLALAFALMAFNLQAAEPWEARTDSCSGQKPPHRFKATQLIAPLGLVAVGATIAFTPWGQGINESIKAAMGTGDPSTKWVDDILQFTPLALTYGLNLCGVRGRHNYRDLSIITATATLLMLGSVHLTKELAGVLRPDGSAHNAWPSGHTAMAFVGAHILFQEYRHKSVWYGVGGYLFAAGIGAMRIYHNRHWLGDVVAGAGYGILCAQAAYWLYPVMQRWFFPTNAKRHKSKSKHDIQAMSVMPFYDGKRFGAGIHINF